MKLALFLAFFASINWFVFVRLFLDDDDDDYGMTTATVNDRFYIRLEEAREMIWSSPDSVDYDYG